MSTQNKPNTDQEKIGGRHEPEEFDAMLARLKQLAGSGERETYWNPETRRYGTRPKNKKSDKNENS